MITYVQWAGRNCLDAIEAKIAAKIAYYKGLVNTANEDMKDAYIEWRTFSVKIKAVTDHAGSELAMAYETFAMMFGLDAKDFEPASPPALSSLHDAKTSNGVPGPVDELGDLIDLTSNNFDHQEEINAISKSTGVSELITADRGPLPVAKRLTVSLPRITYRFAYLLPLRIRF